MSADDQADIYDAHKDGEFFILSCSRLLNTGYDEPEVSCLIDCYPTKSIIQFCQRAGRTMRIAEGKENAIYLDHAGNVSRHGFAEDIIPSELDNEEKEYNERDLTKDKDEPKVKECPQCFQQMVGIRCKCGYEIAILDQIETDNQELEKLYSVDAKSWNNKTSKESKKEFYGMLKYFVASKGMRPGKAAYMYRDRSGVFPNAYKDAKPTPPSKEFNNYLAHLAIKRNRSKVA
jgi:superfamily II DNA or RNA helicase